MELLRLYQDGAVRNSLAGIMRPVKESGIERVGFRDGNQTIAEVTKDDVTSFDAPDVQELVVDEVRRQAFSIISLAFKEDNKWRLTGGDNTFSVSMRDSTF